MKRIPYCYEWPRPGVTVDIVLFTVAGALNDLRRAQAEAEVRCF